MDDVISKLSEFGQTYRADWQKSFNPTTAAVAGEWHSLQRGAGNPPADNIMNTGTNLSFQQLKDTTTGAGNIQHGGDVSPNYKHILNVSAYTAAGTVAPCVLQLVDLLGWYRVTSVTTTTAQATTNTFQSLTTFTADAGTDIITHNNIGLQHLTLVRLTTTGTLPAGLATGTDYYTIKVSDTTLELASSYANAVAGTQINITDAGTGTHTIATILPRYTNGNGVQAYFVNTNATALGAATPNLSLGYTNSTGTASRATPAVLPIGKTAAANQLVLYSGTGNGKYNPYVPKQAGDTGIASVQTIQNSTSYVSGEYAVVLCRPILTLPITTLGVAAERDLLNQVPSLPRIYDGACLSWLMYSGAATPANSALIGHIDFAWG